MPTAGRPAITDVSAEHKQRCYPQDVPQNRLTTSSISRSEGIADEMLRHAYMQIAFDANR